MKKILYTFLFFLFVQLNAQEKDSLFVNFNDSIQDATTKLEKIKVLISASDYYLDNKLNVSERYLLEAISLTEKDDALNLSRILEKLAIINRKKGMYAEAVKQASEAKVLYEELKDTLGVVRTLNSLGVTGRFRGVNKESITYFNKAIKLSNEKGYLYQLGVSYNMKGIAYRRLKEYDSARINYERAIRVFNNLNNKNQVSSVNNNLAVLYSSQGEYKKSLTILLTNLKHSKNYRDPMTVAIAYFNIARDYFKLKDFKKSYSYIDSSYNLSSKKGYLFRIAKAYELKGLLKEKEGDFKKALEFRNRFYSLSDSIYNVESEKKLREYELNRKFDLEKKEIEITTKEQKKKNQLYIFILALLFILGSFITYLLLKNYRGKNKYLATKVDKQNLQRDLLNEQVKVAEAELKWLVADNSMRLVYIKQLSEKLKDDLKENQSIETKSYIKALMLQLQQQITTENKLTTIQNKAEEVNRGFEEKLLKEYPELTKSEREVCSLLRVNLSIKEVSAIRNTTPEAIKSIRYRLRKKLGVSKGIELESFVKNI